ncbi:UNVERIFIED_CONTAM: hypothetical protein HDU68_000297 [Siphonaria sp. JEL0065]|nr:hypothetical protein HDU68_000297 [Siphonaria sp. JEL0065]
MLVASNTVTSQWSIGSQSTTDRPTLQMVLTPFAVYGNAFDVRFGSIAAIVGKALGTAPSAFHTYATWPLLVEAYSALAFTNNSKLSVELKRLVAIVSSLVAQCAYCSALACGLGDVFNGAVQVTQPLKLSSTDLSPNDRKAIRLIVAATKVPARVTPEMQLNVHQAFAGKAELQDLAQAFATGGFLNTLNSLLACELDEPVAATATEAFKGSLFSFGPHKFLARMKSNPFRKIIDVIQLAQEAKAVSQATEVFLSGVPTSNSALDEFLENLLGFQPRYLKKITNIGLKRVYCTLFSKLVFWTDEDDDIASGTFDGIYQPDLPFTDRLVICYVYFMGASNHLLALHFAYVAIVRFGVDPSELELSLMAAQDFNHKSDKSVHNPLEIMAALSYYSARRYHRRMWRLAPKLYSATENPATVMAFVSLTSFLTLLQRFSAVVDDGKGLEPEVLDFLKTSDAKSIGLHTLTHSSNSFDFDASPEELEIEWDDIDIDTISVAAASLRMSVRQLTAGQVWGGGAEY